MKTSKTMNAAQDDPVDAEDRHGPMTRSQRQQEADRQQSRRSRQPRSRRRWRATRRRCAPRSGDGASRRAPAPRVIGVGQQEAESRGRLPGQAKRQPGRDRRSRPADAREQGQRLAEADRQCRRRVERLDLAVAARRADRRARGAIAPTTRKPAMARRAASLSPWNVSPMKSSSAKPMSAAGIVASTSSQANLRSGSPPMRRSRMLASQAPMYRSQSRAK